MDHNYSMPTSYGMQPYDNLQALLVILKSTGVCLPVMSYSSNDHLQAWLYILTSIRVCLPVMAWGHNDHLLALWYLYPCIRVCPQVIAASTVRFSVRKATLHGSVFSLHVRCSHQLHLERWRMTRHWSTLCYHHYSLMMMNQSVLLPF